jgi:NADPH-dependent 2,4-dienoyl-CoA reductase/sulfur reductase-like enzyme
MPKGFVWTADPNKIIAALQDGRRPQHPLGCLLWYPMLRYDRGSDLFEQIPNRTIVVHLSVTRKAVAIKNEVGEKIVPYDRLIVATGATPIRPNLPGSAVEGVFLLHTMDDSFGVKPKIAPPSFDSAHILP